MKKISTKAFWLLTFTMFFTLPTSTIMAQAQAESPVYKKALKKRKYGEGFVLLKDSTMVKGAIAGASGLLQVVKLITTTGEKQAIAYSDILAYQKGTAYYETDGSLFYRLVKRGERVSFYERIVTTSHPGPNGMAMTSTTSYHYFRKTGTMHFETVSRLNFAKDMARFFADCPALNESLLDRNYSYDRKEFLVDAYDRCD